VPHFRGRGWVFQRTLNRRNEPSFAVAPRGVKLSLSTRKGGRSPVAEAHGGPWREGGLEKSAGFDGSHQGGDQQDESLLLLCEPRLALQQWSKGNPER
jgi:hypothetical protein